MKDIVVNELVGETIQSVDVINAEPGRTSHRYLVFVTESGKRAIQGIPGVTTRLLGTPGGPDPTYEAMNAAPQSFDLDDLESKDARSKEKIAAKEANRKLHLEAELRRIEEELELYD
jgi:hypothetical protein